MHWSSSLKIARVAKNTSLLCLHPASIFHPTTRFLSTSARTTKNMLVYKNPTRGMISHSGPWTKIVEYVRPCNTASPRERFSACWSGTSYDLKPRSQRRTLLERFLNGWERGSNFENAHQRAQNGGKTKRRALPWRCTAEAGVCKICTSKRERQERLFLLLNGTQYARLK